MGSFLDKPSTEKTLEESASAALGLRAGAACMQGWRISMEVRSTPSGRGGG